MPEPCGTDLKPACLQTCCWSPLPAHVPIPNMVKREAKADHRSDECEATLQGVESAQHEVQSLWRATLVFRVHILLHEAAHVLLRLPGRSLPVAELYLRLPVDVTGFMQRPMIWLSDVLELYLDDFDLIQIDGRLTVTYLHSFMVEQFARSTTSKLIRL
eukprot:TRINITY_DN84255_c0_g1_i1.p1 TRINITY_DN84255_c0_g1~~TRINITY_DN84255_c0_g1_i1.p1  ORF type:complete len:159 (+),score=23.69 TRINITY_DN84255_c0_g1_i1:78-554(+)